MAQQDSLQLTGAPQEVDPSMQQGIIPNADPTVDIIICAMGVAQRNGIRFTPDDVVTGFGAGEETTRGSGFLDAIRRRIPERIRGKNGRLTPRSERIEAVAALLLEEALNDEYDKSVELYKWLGALGQDEISQLEIRPKIVTRDPRLSPWDLSTPEDENGDRNTFDLGNLLQVGLGADEDSVVLPDHISTALTEKREYWLSHGIETGRQVDQALFRYFVSVNEFWIDS